MKQNFTLISPQVRQRACDAVLAADDGQVVTIQEETRNLEQNSKMWPMLSDLSKQIIWHGVKLYPDEWKDFATATLKKQKFVPDLDGMGFIAVGGKTSTMSKKKFSDLIEIIYMIGARNDVQWSERSAMVIGEYGVAND